MSNIPRPGDIFYMAKDKPYQIITIGIHKETSEDMVVYQALFGDFKTYVLPMSKFIIELQESADKKITEVKVQDKVEAKVETKAETKDSDDRAKNIVNDNGKDISNSSDIKENVQEKNIDKVNDILLKFLDADTYARKLEVLVTHIKAIDDWLINNMAASLDCTIEEGPLDQRLQDLIYCLKQMSRFEDRRLR